MEETFSIDYFLELIKINNVEINGRNQSCFLVLLSTTDNGPDIWSICKQSAHIGKSEFSKGGILIIFSGFKNKAGCFRGDPGLVYNLWYIMLLAI